MAYEQNEVKGSAVLDNGKLNTLRNTKLEKLVERIVKQNPQYPVSLGDGQIHRSQVLVHPPAPYLSLSDVPKEFVPFFDTVIPMVFPNNPEIAVQIKGNMLVEKPAVPPEARKIIQDFLGGKPSVKYAEQQKYPINNGRVGIAMEVKTHNIDRYKLRECLVALEGDGVEVEGVGLFQLWNYDYTSHAPGSIVPRLDQRQAEDKGLEVHLENIEVGGKGYVARNNKHYNGLLCHTWAGEVCTKNDDLKGHGRDTILFYGKDHEEFDLCDRLPNLFGSTHDNLHFSSRNKEVHAHGRLRLELGCSGVKVHSIEELDRRATEAYKAIVEAGLVTSQNRDVMWQEYLPEDHQALAVVRDLAHGQIECRLPRWFNPVTGNINAVYTPESKLLGSEMELQDWLYRNQPRDEQMVVLRIKMDGQVMERVMEPHGGLPDAGHAGLVLGDKTDKSTAKSRKDRLTASDIGIPSFPFSCDSHRTLVDTSDVEAWWKCGSDWVENVGLSVELPKETKDERKKMLTVLQRNANAALAQYLEDAGGNMQRLSASKNQNPTKFSLVPVVSLVISTKRVDNVVRMLLPDGKTYGGNTTISRGDVGEASRKVPMLLVRGNQTGEMPPKMVRGRMVKAPIYGNAELVALNLANFTKYHRAIGLDKSIECLFWTVDMEDVWRDIEVI